MKQSFRVKVCKIVKRIPRGRTLTYKEIARKAGSPHAYAQWGTY